MLVGVEEKRRITKRGEVKIQDKIGGEMSYISGVN